MCTFLAQSDLDQLQKFLNRRAPGQNDWSTPRREEDRPEFLSGILHGFTTGAPIAAIIPPAATSAALIYVGVLMLQGLSKVDFTDMDQMVPVAIMLIGMPVSGSIGHAIGLGLICYTFMKIFGGKFKEVSWLTYVISALFLVKFFLVV